MHSSTTKQFALQREYGRSQEHNSHSLALLEYFQSIPQDSPPHYWPTTSELQDMKRFGLRPVNRIGDLRDGKVGHYRYDIEKISCGHGINRWRFHWPNRPGHPKPKNQTVLPIEPERPETSFGRSQTHKKPRHPWSFPFSAKCNPPKSWAEVCAERDRKLAESQNPPPLVLVP